MKTRSRAEWIDGRHDLQQNRQKEILDDIKQKKDGNEGVALDFECKQPLNL
jgi:hypothetical protein